MSPEQSRANHPSRTGSVAASQANLAELAKLEEQHIRVNERARIVREIRHFAQNLRERAGTSAERDLMEDVASMADAVADGIHDRRWTDWG